MLSEVRWVSREPEVRHALSLCRVVDAGTRDEWYDLLGVIQVPVSERAPETLRDQLRAWALATLTAGSYGFGRYYAACSTLDEDDEPDKLIADDNINWSGSEVLVPAERPTGDS
ncbi:hypothetical protein Vqi01_21810 [Micromonospora qiuiae]|uniref:DUF4240 domain-containing protein n=1 Tax=Micromonospora qiuiae TaxID=502268 RepID=A0ABQ4JA17_9ACTN|nr:hypothetical protein [Micromonospora qiuiae]GIJ27019.1 hypothetical protein Vqi01_21810 [Micromonospora qiuiae]